MKEGFDHFLPLSPAALHILLALASEDRQGYGIMREIARQSDGRYKLGPGTLYDNLQKLLDQGVVEEHSLRSGGDDPRRRYYRLSRFGRGLLATEIARLEGAKQDCISTYVPRGHDDPNRVSLAYLFASARLSHALPGRTSLDIRGIQACIRNHIDAI